MRARPLMVLIANAAVLTASLAGFEAKVYGSPGAASHAPHVAAPPQAIRPSASPEGMPGSAFDGLPARIPQATQDGAADGATIAVAVLDRTTHQMLSNGNDQLIAIASVAKLFIADDLLTHGPDDSEDNPRLSTADRQELDSMLRSSDDSAAETFWAQRGGEAIISDIMGRYGLTSTAPPSVGRWWNTMSSASDLVHYYDTLLNESGGLSREGAQMIVEDRAGS